MNKIEKKPIIVAGAGPGGLMSALTLNKLGHKVILMEKSKTPKYKVGESLLPGTLSILHRLGLMDKIKAANFKRKPSATFVWGADENPWTFSFATPLTYPWSYDHAVQVFRPEFEEILLEAAAERGIEIRMGYSVTSYDLESNPEEVSLKWRNSEGEKGELVGSFLVDATGKAGLLAKKYKLRQYDEFYKSQAFWSYFKGVKNFGGELDGTTFSITFDEGWIWFIPLKDGVTSVGLVVDAENNKTVKEIGMEAFYTQCLERSPFAMELLGDAEQCEEVRTIREWSYSAEKTYVNRAFMVGDAACFTDPLFSQGVHLAIKSGVYIASTIDYILNNPEEEGRISEWYNKSFKDSYNRYHEFLCSFYSYASELEPQSTFWSRRKITSLLDQRFTDKKWYKDMRDQSEDDRQNTVDDMIGRTSNMINLGKHSRADVTAEFSEDELNVARMGWISKLNKSLRRIKKLEWEGQDVNLVSDLKIDPLSFKLGEQDFLSNEKKNMMTSYAANKKHVETIQLLKTKKLGYKELLRELRKVGDEDNSSQIIVRLIEAGLLKGYDDAGEMVEIEPRLRFDGVGAEYEI